MKHLGFSIAAGAALCAASPIAAQQSGPARQAGDQEAIVVQGEREGPDAPSIVSRLRSIITEADSDQLARFEASVCPMVIGMPRDLTEKLDRMIRENVIAVGGDVARPGCSVNAAVIFIDGPRDLVRALHKEEPTFFFTMTPREFANFADAPRPVYSWHLTNFYSRDGGHVGRTVRSAAATRLYTNIREEMEAGLVVIDRSATVGKTLRQLADFATMHLLLDVNQKAGRRDKSSILSLFEQRANWVETPLRMSRFDRGALTGFYTQRENNRTAAQQRQNIAAAIKKGAGEQ